MRQPADSRRPCSIRSSDAMVRGAILFALPVALADSDDRCPICRASSQPVAKFRLAFGCGRGISAHLSAGGASRPQLPRPQCSNGIDARDRTRPGLAANRLRAVADCLALRNLESVGGEWVLVMKAHPLRASRGSAELKLWKGQGFP